GRVAVMVNEDRRDPLLAHGGDRQQRGRLLPELETAAAVLAQLPRVLNDYRTQRALHLLNQLAGLPEDLAGIEWVIPVAGGEVAVLAVRGEQGDAAAGVQRGAQQGGGELHNALRVGALMDDAVQVVEEPLAPRAQLGLDLLRGLPPRDRRQLRVGARRGA